MAQISLSSFAIASPIGKGMDATVHALRNRCSGLRPCDFLDVKLDTHIGRVEGVEDISLNGEWSRFDCRNNRLAQLALRQDSFLESVSGARKRYGPRRIAVVMGTSTSGILETELAYRTRDPVTGDLHEGFRESYPFTHNSFSVAGYVSNYLNLYGPTLVISTACSSSAKVFASAHRLIEIGLCDAAVVGGVDSLCLTTLYGFASLGLVSHDVCRPCDVARDGLNIGEAAGFVLLEKASDVSSAEKILLLGYGESCDGYHMSHPHPEGLGAELAMLEALNRAGMQPSDIDYIQLHGTATKSNDEVEDKAVSRIFGRGLPCSSTKGWTGHTLGAAGAVGAIIAALCISRGIMPGTLNTKTVDPNMTSHILLDNRAYPVKRVLSNFFGFGGSNCSLVIGAA